MSGLLLCAAIALLYWADRMQRDPVVTICRRCGDMVRHAPGWPVRCPSCTGLVF